MSRINIKSRLNMNLVIFSVLLICISPVLSLTKSPPECIIRGNEIVLSESRYPSRENFVIKLDTDIDYGKYVAGKIGNRDIGQCRVLLDGTCTFNIEPIPSGNYELKIDHGVTHESFDIKVLPTVKIIPHGVSTYPVGDIEFSVTIKDDNGQLLDSQDVTLLVYSDDNKRGRNFIEDVENVGSGVAYEGNWLVRDVVTQKIDVITYEMKIRNENPDVEYYSDGYTEHEIRTQLKSLEVSSPQSDIQIGVNKRTDVEFKVTDYSTGLVPDNVNLNLIRIIDSDGIERTSEFGNSFKKKSGDGTWEVTFTPDKAEAWSFIVQASGSGYSTQTEEIVISVWKKNNGGDDTWWEKYGTYVILIVVLGVVGFFIWKLFFNTPKKRGRR